MVWVILATVLAEGNNDVTAWTGILGTIANIGFSAIVGWYLLTKAMPKQAADFTETIAKIQDGFFASLEKRDTIADTREIRGTTEAKAALSAVLAHCDAEAKRRDESFVREMELVRMAIKDQREIMEDSRDVLRDLAKALEEERRSRKGAGS